MKIPGLWIIHSWVRSKIAIAEAKLPLCFFFLLLPALNMFHLACLLFLLFLCLTVLMTPSTQRLAKLTLFSSPVRSDHFFDGRIFTSFCWSIPLSSNPQMHPPTLVVAARRRSSLWRSWQCKKTIGHLIDVPGALVPRPLWSMTGSQPGHSTILDWTRASRHVS